MTDSAKTRETEGRDGSPSQPGNPVDELTPTDDSPDRDADIIADEDPPRLAFPVVGIGASAGGLEAVTEFLDAVPPDSGIAFVLVQHLPPDRDSMMVEILSRKTRIPVRQAEDGMPLEPNTFSIIRPGYTLTIESGALRLEKSKEPRGHGRPIDDLFRSLAREQQERAISIVLSGMGSDGAAGCKAIKTVGGLCIAQDPETAKFPPMPESLIYAGHADIILRPSDMPDALLRYTHHPYAKREPLPTSGVASHYAEALAILRVRTRLDFVGYKKPTVLRRMHRRMSLLHMNDYAEYVSVLRDNLAEATALAEDIMIHVTGFFRDAEAWQSLSRLVIDPLIATREAGDTIRCWVTACSSGEEVFSLAMLLDEACERAGKTLRIKMFATDTAESILAHARQAVYPMGIESEVSPDRLARYFDRDGPHYRVRQSLREMVVFAPQNLLQDPPFSRIDICTCRNLLIYLNPEVQRRALSLMHFSLREGGALFLGASETVSGTEGMFDTIDKRWRIFRRVGPPRRTSMDLPRLSGAHADPATLRSAEATGASASSVGSHASRALLAGHTPAAVVIDQKRRIMHFHGRSARYLTQPEGNPTRDILALARDGVRDAIRQALERTPAQGDVGAGDAVFQSPDGPARVSVLAAPLDAPGLSGHTLLTFTDRPENPRAAPAAPGEPVSPGEVLRMRDELQSMVEELQTSNEEMRASHEEITSINEELQSTNEELETSKEELQSLNEELSTVNAQLQAKMEELESTTNDLGSLLSSTDIAVVFLDPRFRIRRFTPAMRDLLDLIPGDIGRPLRDMAFKFNDPALFDDADAVLQGVVPNSREIRSASGRWYLRRALPYRAPEDRVDGVVITFIDITERQLASRERDAIILREQHAREQAEAATRMKDEFLNTLSHELRTPLATIMIWATLLQTDAADPERIKEGVAAIRSCALSQRRLIDDLLDAARISSGKMRLENRLIDLDESLAACVNAMRPAADERQHEVRVELAPDLGVVRTDPERIAQIVRNLLSNSIKFTDPGGVITIRAARSDDVVAISVSDTGAGIAPEFIPYLFQRFRQADASVTRRVGGLGLGLAICKELVDLFQGSIEADSEGEGRGATITVRLDLPAFPDDDTDAPHATPGRSDALGGHDGPDHHPLRGATALVVEDDRDTLNALVALLREFGAMPIRATCVDDAVRAFEESRPDVILSDIGLPDNDGLDFIKRVRDIENRDHLARTPALALTAYVRDSMRQESLLSGFDDHLTKPVDPALLARALLRLTERHDNGAAPSPAPDQPGNPTSPALD